MTMMLTERCALVKASGCVLEALSQTGSTLVQIAVTNDDVVVGIGETKSGHGVITYDRCLDVLRDFGVPQAILSRYSFVQEKRNVMQIPGAHTWLMRVFGMGVHELPDEQAWDDEPEVNVPAHELAEQLNTSRVGNPVL